MVEFDGDVIKLLAGFKVVAVSKQRFSTLCMPYMQAVEELCGQRLIVEVLLQNSMNVVEQQNSVKN